MHSDWSVSSRKWNPHDVIIARPREEAMHGRGSPIISFQEFANLAEILVNEELGGDLEGPIYDGRHHEVSGLSSCIH